MTKIAMFRSAHGEIHFAEAAGDGDTVMSEWETVTFRPLPSDKILAIQLKALAEQKARIHSNTAAALMRIEQQELDLLAMNGQPAPVAMPISDWMKERMSAPSMQDSHPFWWSGSPTQQ